MLCVLYQQIMKRKFKRLIDLLCLTPLSAIFQLYHVDQFQWWQKPKYPERTTAHGQATGKLYHLRLRRQSTIPPISKKNNQIFPHSIEHNKTTNIHVIASEWHKNKSGQNPNPDLKRRYKHVMLENYNEWAFIEIQS